MTIKDLMKLTKLNKLELENYGIDDDTDIHNCAESMRDLMLSAERDLEGLIHPDNGLSSMIEHDMLTDRQKSEIFVIMKQLCKLNREYRAAKVSGTTELTKWISKFHKYWNVQKKHIITLSEDIAKSWDSDKAEILKVEYFG